jgi:hypothetical protein
LKLKARRAEIEQEASVSSGCPEIVDALRAMRAVERSDGFQFDQDGGVVDQEIDGVFAYGGAFVCDDAVRYRVQFRPIRVHLR